MIVIATLLRKLQTVKDVVNHSVKNAVSEHVLTVNMLTVPNSCKMFMRPLSLYFSTTLTEPDLENISLSDMLNLRCVL